MVYFILHKKTFFGKAEKSSNPFFIVNSVLSK